jgi:hypothetical protein
LNLESLKCHFPDFGERFYRILMVRKRHCDISEALANVFALQPEGPPFGPLWFGAPGFARSEPIVVTPLGDQQDSVDSAGQLGPAACNLDVQLCRHGPVTVLIEFLNNRLCHSGVFG